MISRVRGELRSVRAGRVELTAASGVTYEMLVPAGLLGTVGPTGATIELHTALVAREDSLELFGFGSERDRELFHRLQGASGVGPKLALAILGALPASRIVSAIRSRDHAVLQVVSGVGRKTAERIALELADKLDDLGAAVGNGVSDAEDVVGGALAALRALGYSSAESDAALTKARRELLGKTQETEDLIRVALRNL